MVDLRHCVPLLRDPLLPIIKGILAMGGSQELLPEDSAGTVLPVLPGLPNLHIYMVDPALQTEPMEALIEVFLQSHGETSRPVVLSTTGESKDAVAESPPDSPGTTDQRSPGQQKDYPVECLLDKWAGWFFVKWLDGSCSWEPLENVLDDKLIDDLEARHRGLGCSAHLLY